jgi:Multiubiquitin
MAEQQSDKNGHHLVEITIDGDEYSVADRSETVTEILGLAGKDPQAFELIELIGKRDRNPLPDPNQTVHLHPGSAFITVPVGPMPVS